MPRGSAWAHSPSPSPDERFPLNRKLDHLFTAGRWLASATLQDAVLLSDHVPVVAELVVP